VIHSSVVSRVAALLGAFTLAAALAAAPARAADVTDIGYLDQGAIASLKPFVDANRQLVEYKTGLDKEFVQRMKGVSNASDQAKIAREFQQKLSDKQRAVLAPLFQRAQTAIASVASSKNLSVIVDRHIIIVGGQDVTRNVIDLLTGVGAPVPPVSTPPPSSVGYVDQTEIDAVPKLKSANDEMLKFRDEQGRAAQEKLKGAKTDADRQAVLKAFQQALADKQKVAIDPLVEQTRNAIAGIARKRGLILVIDKSNLVYGGTDITSDVTSAIK
jgi:outer membrane protein